MSLIDRIAKIATTVPYAYGGGPAAVPMVLPGGVQQYADLKPTEEFGTTGLLRTRGVGFVYEEWLAQLSVNKQRKIFRQMRDNDAVLGALFFALETILRTTDWYVEEAKGNSKAVGYARFFEECMDDMSHTWEDFIAETVNMFTFGFSLAEPVYKRRDGPTGESVSRFDDGLIGWRKLAPRAQESIEYWEWDDEGGLRGCVQLAPPNFRTIPIPIERLLLFRTTSIKNNPEGRSVLRNCFRPWLLKTRDEEVEGIGLERDLCGLPVLYASAEAIAQMGGRAKAERMIRNIRVDSQMGAVLPAAFDGSGNRVVQLELLKTAGGKQFDAGAIIKRHNQDILNTVLAGFIQLGQTETGARALHISATQIFARALSVFMKAVAAVMNRHAIPRLMDLNGMDLGLAPKLVPGEIEGRDLEELGNYVAKLAAAGIALTDPDTASILRKKADLPDQPSEMAQTFGLDDDSTAELDEGDDPVQSGDNAGQQEVQTTELVEKRRRAVPDKLRRRRTY